MFGVDPDQHVEILDAERSTPLGVEVRLAYHVLAKGLIVLSFRVFYLSFVNARRDCPSIPTIAAQALWFVDDYLDERARVADSVKNGEGAYVKWIHQEQFQIEALIERILRTEESSPLLRGPSKLRVLTNNVSHMPGSLDKRLTALGTVSVQGEPPYNEGASKVGS